MNSSLATIFKGPFVLFADCEVYYEGRASSKLARGNYLVVRKPDDSLQIHTSQNIKPINYQGQGCKFEYLHPCLTCHSSRELIKIRIHSAHSLIRTDSWGHNELQIVRTENDLKQVISSRIDELTQDKIECVTYEHPTPYGPVDVLARGAFATHVIEVKRKTASVAAAGQIARYKNHLDTELPNPIYWLMAPGISPKCLDYCNKNGIRWKEVNFPTISKSAYGCVCIPFQPAS